MVQEFGNKFSDLGVVPGRHDWYVTLAKERMRNDPGGGQKKNFYKNKMIRISECLFSATPGKKTDLRNCPLLGIILWWNRDHLSGHKLYSYTKVAPSDFIAYGLYAERLFFSKYPILSVCFHSSLSRSSRKYSKTSTYSFSVYHLIHN